MTRGSAAASAHDRLAALVATRPAGWGQPKGQRHAHRYAAGGMLSACGRALYFGPVVPEPRPPMTPCKTCATPTEGPEQ